jgi:hypothetical protein
MSGTTDRGSGYRPSAAERGLIALPGGMARMRTDPSPRSQPAAIPRADEHLLHADSRYRQLSSDPVNLWVGSSELNSTWVDGNGWSVFPREEEAVSSLLTLAERLHQSGYEGRIRQLAICAHGRPGRVDLAEPLTVAALRGTLGTALASLESLLKPGAIVVFFS